MRNIILLRFKKDIRKIASYYRKLIDKTKLNENVGTVNEWLVDNFYIISEQEKYIKAEYKSRELKKITSKRRLQIDSMIYKQLENGDYNLSISNMFINLNKYQKENNDYFSYREINYIYIVIRMMLISKLSNLVRKLNTKLDEKDEVEKIFNKINTDIKIKGSFNIENYIEIDNSLIKRPYYIELINYKLKELGRYSEKAFITLNNLISENNMSLKQLIKISHDEKTSDNVLMINLFNSIKKIAKYKTEFLYKNLSFAEKQLISEKVNIYDQMYENNKSDYRTKLIRNAKKENKSEYEYAKELVEKANKEGEHVGWYLFPHKNNDKRAILYISTIAISTIVISLILSKSLGSTLFPLLLIPMSVVVMEILAQILRRFAKTRSSFKLKFENGLPKEYSTMIVIPTLVKNKEKVNKALESLEVYYLSNKTDNLYFTLLGDCPSHPIRDADYDKEIVEAGLKKVEELNSKYGKKIFNFIYRRRVYSNDEETYLGYERKRGALLQFNQLLLGKLSEKQKKEYYKCHTFDDFDVPIKYVITLDNDTKLVLNTALKLIGTMAHPLNRPVLSKDRRKVIQGYGIMQPRVGIDVEVTNKSIYSQLFAGLGGLDIYTTASFDLYQDIFGEGSFVGKGIYDLKVFDQVLSEAFPDNLILSHDLIEGNYVRSGFINDVELFDDYPSRYLNDASRHHRWNRGDWQIIGWLRKRVKNKKGKIVDNPISILGKWKIFDNLRRSVVSLFLLLVLFYGFTIGKSDAFYYFLIVILIVAIPIFFFALSKILYRQKYDRFLKYYLNLIRGLIAVLNKSFIVLAVLPYEANLYVDSIMRALYRMYISKKNLLNWVTAEEVEKISKNTLFNYIKAFKINYIIAFLLTGLTYIFKPYNITLAFILSFIWLIAPIVMYLVSKDLKQKGKTLNEEEIKQLERVAEITWRYFDDLLKEEYNYLIPDNYQYNRDNKVDHKTSPTNIGFSLLSIISAKELELISKKKTIGLIREIIKTVEKLEKWNGYLYNWYNIYNLNVLQPKFISSVDNGNFVACLYVVRTFLEKNGEFDLAYRITRIIDNIDFSRLYNYKLDVFSLGYNVSEETLQAYHYNNFASESRLTSYLAIAKGDIPYKHWFCLDKTLTRYKYYKGVASWGGSTFEYFMPLIFLKTYNHTLMDEAYHFAHYASRKFIEKENPNLPWGISESAYNQLDDADNYKYGSFGIPYLKMHESSKYRVVISPYSSIMAIDIDDRDVFNNMQKFVNLDMYGNYGFYEAYDYEDKAIVKNYYAHHQGMILASLTNYLKDGIIREYFHTDKGIQSMEILLKEKVQIKTYIDLKVAKYKRYQYQKETTENDFREFEELSNLSEVGLLSNGFYSTIINDRGIGFSKYKNLQINRYREISDEDYGIFVYIRNLASDKIWSNTYAPFITKPNKYKVVMASDRIKYVREDEGIVTTTEIMVVKDHNAEIRKITFSNKTNKPVELEVTSYGEVIMARREEDVAHRAFNSMTITSEIDEKTSSLIFNRSSRTKDYTTYFVAARMFVDGKDDESFEFETSREKFIGRNNNVSNPDVIINKKPLSNSVGATLDPIMSIRKRIKVEPKSTESVYLLVGFSKSKEQVLEIVQNYKDELSVTRAFNIATVFNNMRINYANLKATEMRLYNRMLKYIVQRMPDTKERSLLLKNNKLGIESLWKFGISGDWPIILVEIDKIEDLGFIKQILQAYEFYKSRAVYVDIVIINYEIPKKEKIVLDYIGREVYRINTLNYLENTPGNVYVISEEDMSEAEKSLLYLTSRVSFKASSSESLEEQLNRLDEATLSTNIAKEIKPINNLKIDLPKDIEFYNGYGGFINQGKEYLISSNNTPTPWINILVNPTFGSIISNSGSSFTFSHNSREYKLSYWSNDIIGDPNSEIITINKERFVPSLVKHGFGYTTLYSSTKDYDIFVKVFVSKEKREKFYKLNITNKKKAKLSLDLDFIIKIVLGVSPELTNRYIVTTFDKKDNCLYLKNNYNPYFKNIKTFISSSEKIKEYNDKDHGIRSITVNLDIDPNDTKTCTFVLGTLNDDEKYEEPDNGFVNDEFNKVTSYWKDKLSVITVETPDKSFNYMMNGWCLYQTYASRLYAKAGLYQVGGAYGFRDQLQDILAIIYSNPDFARNQILKHASHQFKEGDVLHWWHEELKFGARTRFSDDYLWLPYITYEYIEKTGDYKILEELVPFVEGPSLLKTEREKGINYVYSKEKETLYNHLKLCLDKALNSFGKHGLPLMHGGDWNDGMNRVGYKGKGESIFVGFFLYDILFKMIKIAKHQKDNESNKLWTSRQEDLKEALEKNTWDGSWYLRAYFDNGISLGSRNNKECQIDLLNQAWSIISGIATSDKKESIYKSVEQMLIDNENKIIKLLTPPFKDINPSPGYIKDYPVGIRENGAQYTHAALWYILALLKEKKGDKAFEYYQMINPINRSLTKEDVLKYKVEPYVIAADIYSNSMHLGRGGWTWYTGSASWAYKIGLENILGFNKIGDTLTINPNISSKWDQYKITYKYKNTIYNIEVINENHLSSGKVIIELDNKVLKDNIIKLVDDNKTHKVVVTMKEEV